LGVVKLLIYALLAGAAGFMFYSRFYRWLDCFNELGRCYDPDGTGQVYTDAGHTWIYPAALFLVLAAWQAIRPSGTPR
jgi:hypothetical protein